MESADLPDFASYLALAAVALVAAACGSSEGARTIEIEMRDIAFAPERITVPAGEEVRLVFRNTGKVAHDAFIGDAEAQADHEVEMNDDAGMHHGADEDGVTVEPGETGTITHTFDAGDEVLIGCHQPGHYEAGMKLRVTTT